MLNKRGFLIMSIFILILIQSNLIFAGPVIHLDLNPADYENETYEDYFEPANLTDYGKDIGFEEGELMGYNMLLEISGIDYFSRLIDFSFVNIDSILIINGSEFWNIQPYNEDISYANIAIDNDLKIKYADFIINDLIPFGYYNINGREIAAPSNSRIKLTNGIIGIWHPDGSDLSNYAEKYFNSFFNIGPTTWIHGNNIKLSNDLLLDSGELELNKNGYLLKEGSHATYKENKLSAIKDEEIDIEILIANPGQDMRGYKGNWIRQTEETLKIQSGVNGKIKLEILENHEIFNTDYKDKLNIEMLFGDGLLIEKRSNENLIPLINYQNIDELGFTKIENNGFTILMDSDGIVNLNHISLEKEDVLNSKYQSVAMEISSFEGEFDKKLRINSYRQFSMISKDNKDLLTFNKYGLPISSKIDDNSLQSMSQLQEKYPYLEFGFYYPYRFGEDVPPYLLYLTDEFFKQNPGIQLDLNSVYYSDKAEASMGKDGQLTIGRKVVDTNDLNFEENIREISKPLQILTHEYEHRLDGLIIERENAEFNEFGNKEINSLKFIINMTEEEINLLNKFRSERILEWASREEIVNISNQIEEKEKLLESRLIKINQLYSEKFSDTLQQKYNEIVLNAKEEILTGESSKKELEKVLIEIEETQIGQPLRIFVYDKYNLNLKELTEKENFKELLINNFKLEEEEIEYIQKNPEENYFYISYYLHELVWKKSLKSLTYSNTEKVAINGLKAFSEEIRELKKTIETGKSNKEFFDPFKELNIIYSRLDNSLVEKQIKNKIDRILRINSGLPYTYGFFNYNSKSEDVLLAQFAELSSTYKEQPLDLRKQRINSGNSKIRNTYISLTQLAFDTDKISIEDYKYLMPEGHCQRPDCSDQLCGEYKLLCCIENPSVPNCN